MGQGVMGQDVSLPARANPFRSECVDALAYRYPAGWSRDAVLRRLAELGNRGAVIGAEGSGKTTLSRDLEGALAGRYRVWRVTQRRGQRFLQAALPRLGPADFVILDGAEQLAWLEFRRLRWRARRAGGLLILSHRTGLLPMVLATAPDQALLDDLVAELTPGRGCPADLLARHGGNIREALRSLYLDRAGIGAGAI